MYAMYPTPSAERDTTVREWGPDSHRLENPHSREALQRALDLRDNGGPRPDDN